MLFYTYHSMMCLTRYYKTVVILLLLSNTMSTIWYKKMSIHLTLGSTLNAHVIDTASHHNPCLSFHDSVSEVITSLVLEDIQGPIHKVLQSMPCQETSP